MEIRKSFFLYISIMFFSVQMMSADDEIINPEEIEFIFEGDEIVIEGSITSGYFIDFINGQPRFFQRLVWRGGEYALRYEVEIESEESGAYHHHRREFTVNRYIVISLTPGRYRFRVTPYDILDRPSEGSAWMNFEVIPAVKPEVHETQSEYIESEDGEETADYILNITGSNIDPEAEIYIRLRSGENIDPQIIAPREENHVQLLIEGGILNPGDYEIVIRNPGGLEAVIGKISSEDEIAYEDEIETEVTDEHEAEQEIVYIEEEATEDRASSFLKPLLINFGVSWVPSFHIYGDSAGTGNSFGIAALRASALYKIPFNIYIGLELTASWRYYNRIISTENTDEEGETFFSSSQEYQHNIETGINLTAVKWFADEKMAAGLRFGIAYPVREFKFENILANAGVFFTWRFIKNFTADAGLDFTHVFGSNGGYIRPWLGAGFIF